MRASITVANVDSDGWRVEWKSGVKALQSLLQAGVWAQKILERGSGVARIWERVSKKPETSGNEIEEHPIRINQRGPSATAGKDGARYQAKRSSSHHCCCLHSCSAMTMMRFQ